MQGAARQQNQELTSHPNGCITVVDDDGRLMIDRKLLLEAKNQSHQAKARKLFTQSRKTYG